MLELLGTCGTDSMWPGWQPPAFPPPPEASGAADSDPAAAPAAAGRFSHHQALLFTRTAAALAVEWPAAVQECRLSSADFADAEAAEAALLRLAAAAEEAPQLRLLLRLLSEVLTEAAFAAVAAAATAEAPAAPAVSGDGGEAAAAPLHRAWSACLRALLPLGDLPGVLASLDEQAARREEQPAAPAPMTQQEAGALVEAADATHGPAAAASLALLLPYAQLQRGRWDQLLQACSSRGSSPADLAGGLPGLAALLLLVVRRRPGLLAELAGGGQQEQELLKRLVAAALLQASAPNGSFGSSLGGSSLTLRMALAASAAAHLAQARQYTAASWLAMQACGTPRLLQVLDSRARVLQQLLRSCAAGTPAAAGALTAADTLAAATAESSALPLSQTAAGLLRALPEQCSQAAAQLVADLQLQ